MKMFLTNMRISPPECHLFLGNPQAFPIGHMENPYVRFYRRQKWTHRMSERAIKITWQNAVFSIQTNYLETKEV